MQTLGFPDEGYCEFKLEDMYERNTKIITSKGMVYTLYECGLPQGSVLSCIISNVVLRRKHLMWKIRPGDPSKQPVQDDDSRHLDGYTFKLTDPIDAGRTEHITINMDG